MYQASATGSFKTDLEASFSCLRTKVVDALCGQGGQLMEQALARLRDQDWWLKSLFSYPFHGVLKPLRTVSLILRGAFMQNLRPP